MRAACVLMTLMVATGAWSAKAEALPLLQLDMAGGIYDITTETIVAPGGTFTVYALLSPKNHTSDAQLQALLDETYYVSVALTPQVGPAPVALGSFTFSGTTVSASGDGPGGNLDMTYGTPPIDAFGQAHDPGDLSKHAVYPTYFAEFAFQFDEDVKTLAYNSQDSPGGLNPSSVGTAYYVSFSGDSSLLAAGYNLHFDLYDTYVNHFAPFSHDAETVPEPSTALLMMVGVGAGAGFFRRRPGATLPK